jgi:cytidylate kinase
MYPKTTSEQLAEAMERQRRRWQKRDPVPVVGEAPRPPSPPGFTIALSREAGANGSLVARAVGERLGWQVYDRELLQRVAEDMRVRTGLVESVDERRKGWFQEYLQAFSCAPQASEGAYVRHLLQTILALSTHGECVIVGRGAAQALPAATTLRVRLVGAREDRIRTIRQRLGLSPEEAARWVTNTDAERDRFIRERFHKDPNDPRGYDLILNTSRFSVAACAELIIEALHRLQGAVAVGGPASGPSGSLA